MALIRSVRSVNSFPKGFISRGLYFASKWTAVAHTDFSCLTIADFRGRGFTLNLE